MASEKLEVIIGLILDSGDKQKSERALSDFESSIQGIEKAVDKSNKSLKDQKQILEDLKDSMKTLREKQKEYVKGSADYNHLGKEIKTVSDRIAEQTARVKTETLEYGKLKDQLQKVQQEEKNRLAIMNREAAMLNRMAALRAKELGDLKEKAAWIEKGARPLFALGVSSFTAITLLAKKYIDSTEESNEITQRWATSSERVQAAQMRIGKIAAEAVLPLYEKLADIAEKAADFADKNPGVIEGGLKASIVAAGLGGIGLLVSKGITLYADLKMIAVGDMQLLAAKIMADAARMQLTAATGGKVTGAGGAAAATATVGKVATTGTVAAGGATLGTIASAVGLIVLGVIASAAAVVAVDQLIAKTKLGEDIQAAKEEIRRTSRRPYPGVVGPVGTEGSPYPGVVSPVSSILGARGRTQWGLATQAQQYSSTYTGFMPTGSGFVQQEQAGTVPLEELVKIREEEVGVIREEQAQIQDLTETINNSSKILAEDGSYVSASFYKASQTLRNATTSAMIMAEDGSFVSASFYKAGETLRNAAGHVGNAMSNVQRSVGFAVQAVSRFPSAMSSISSSISSFFQRIISSITGSRVSAGTGIKAPIHDYTGYAYTRTYAMAQDGKRQFVMSGDMTRMAEQMLGGQLNQQAVLSAIAGTRSSSQSVNVSGMSFSGEYTKAMRKAVKEDVYEVFTKVMKK